MLQNLVNKFLIDFDPHAREDLSTLSEEEVLKKKNQRLIYELTILMPFTKVKQGRYLIGSEVHSVQVKGNGVLLRTGGGFILVSEYMLHNARAEAIKLDHLMKTQNMTLQEVVIGIIKKTPGTQKEQKAFLKRCPPEVDTQFRSLVQQLHEIEPEMFRQHVKQRKSIK